MDWKPERAIQAKVRDFKEKRKGKVYTKEKQWLFEGWIWKVPRLSSEMATSAMYLVHLKGLTPTEFWLKGFTPTAFETSPVILFPLKVTKCLYCDARPLLDLPMFVSTVLSLYCHMSLIHIHSCIHSMHTNIIHTWLHYYPVSYFKRTLKRMSSPMCLIQRF